MKKHEDCWLFVDPVTEAIAPGYHDVIKLPMDVVTVEKKLKNEEYSNKVLSTAFRLFSDYIEFI